MRRAFHLFYKMFLLGVTHSDRVSLSLVETVKYLFPAPEELGHWAQPENEPPRVTKNVLRKAKEPITDQKWVAMEKEVADALTTRRRLREKTSARKMEVEEKEPKSEENAEKEKFQQLKQRLGEIIDEEMKHMVEDDPDIAVEELKWVAKMKRMMEEPSEEDEILQTKVISSREVARSWKSWLAAIDAEVQSLLEKNKKLRKRSQEKSWRRFKKKHPRRAALWRSYRPNWSSRSKLVQIVASAKPAWVICGNYESKKDSEQTFSSGADAAAFNAHLGSSPTSMGWSSHRHQDCFSQRLDGSGRQRGHPDCEATCAVYSKLCASKSGVWPPPFSEIVGYVPR